MTDRDWAKAYDNSPENWGEEYRASAAGESTEKDLEPEVYFDWRDRVIKAM